MARTCITCGRLADGESFPILNRGTRNEARRKVCHHCFNDRKARDRAEAAGGRPTPRPPEALQTSAHRLWSVEDDQRMRDLIASGTPYEEIAVALGRSLSAVYKRRTILGIARVRPSARVAEPWRVDQPGRVEVVNVPRYSRPKARPARRTHCHKGHEFTEANTRVRKNGARVCRECDKGRYERYKK